MNPADAWPCGLAHVGPDHALRAVNHRLAAWLGTTPAALLGRRVDEILPPEGRIFYHSQLVPRVSSRGAATEIYLRLAGADGTRVPVLLNAERASPPEGAGLRCAFFRASARDQFEAGLIDARKTAEVATQRHAALAERLSRLRDERSSSVAHSLHEDLAQSLSALRWKLAPLGRESAPSASARWADVLALVDDSIELARGLALQLQPLDLRLVGLRASTKRLVDSLAADTDLEVEIHGDPPRPDVDDTVHHVLFRVIEEGVSNVIRHAQARRVQIELGQDTARAWAVIVDDGIGVQDPSAAQSRGLGLLESSERVARAGGRLSLGVAPGGGTRLEASIPLPPRSR